MVKKVLIIILIAVVIIAQRFVIVQTDKDLQNTKESLWRTQEELLKAEELIVETQEELDKYVTPIQYDRAAAPVYSSLPISEELQQYTYNTCVVYGVEEYYSVVLAVMWQESNFDANAVSTTNDYGIMQINQCNHDYLKENLGIVDIMDPQDNIESGIYILSSLLQKYGDAHKALMAYNMGPTNASEQWSRGNYTSAYSRSVMDRAELIELNQYSEDI